MFFLSIFLLKFLMTLARAICVCYGAARGHTTYGLEMRTWNNKGFSGSSTSVYDSSVTSICVLNFDFDLCNFDFNLYEFDIDLYEFGFELYEFDFDSALVRLRYAQFQLRFLCLTVRLFVRYGQAYIYIQYKKIFNFKILLIFYD